MENKKNLSKIIIVAVACLIVFSLAIIVSNNKKYVSSNHIIEVSYDDYMEKSLNDEYTIFLFASPSCTHCIKYKPLLNKAAADYNLDVYYLNVNGELTSEQYTNIHDKFSALKDQYSPEGYPSIPTPTTVIVKNNEEIASTSGNIGYDGFVKFLRDNHVL